MGKASRWILNFLIGKQEKKKEAPLIEQCASSTTKPSHPGSPKVKRRWSFSRSSHRVSKSLDSIDSAKLPLPLPLKPQLNHAVWISKQAENAAATSIQAAFRAHLARKALHALKSLVKLQALIRGHFVRKQTNATMKRMHALLAIQVRARFQRIQMAKAAAQVENKSQSSIRSGSTYGNEVHRKKMYMASNGSQTVSKSTTGYMTHSQTNQRIDHSYTSFSSDRLSVSNRHYNETLFITPENSPRMPSPKPKPTRPYIPFRQHDSLVEPTSNEYSYMPSYMANTQSSRAKKVRSQSEPKQRPDGSNKHRSKHTELVDSTDEQFLRRSSTHFKTNDQKNHDLWFGKLYRPRRLFEDNKYDYINPSRSEYTESLAAELLAYRY